MQQNKKETQQVTAILVGTLAILLVIGFTIFRSGNNPKQTESEEGFALDGIAYFPITGPQLMEKIKNNDASIVDIRSITEYGFEHIVNSMNAPIETLTDNFIVDKSRDIVIVSTTKAEDLKKAISLLGKKTNKRIFVLQGGFADWNAIGGSTVTWGDISSFTDQAKTSFITIDELKEKIKSGSALQIIDTRRSIYFNEGHIYGAINIPLAELEQRINQFDKSKEIIIYSDDETEAFQAAIKAFDIRFIPSLVLKGGLDEWKKLNYAIEK